jgi:Bacterial Ig-like domain (group 3)
VPVTVASEPSTTTFSTLNANLLSSTSTTYSDFFFLQAAVAGASNQGAASGTVTFSDTFNGNTGNLMSAPLSIQGSVLVQETSLAIGTHTLSASYSGDASFQPSVSSSITVTVTKAITQTFLFAPSGAPPNSPITLQAIVFQSGVAVPTGTVQFFSGTQAIGAPVNLRNSVALLTTSQLPTGSNSLTAAYSGDANFNGSTSQPRVVFIGNPDFQIAVNPGNITASASAPGTTTLLVSPGPGLGFAGTVTLTCSGLPTGATCNMQPAQLTLDGFNPASAKVTITKSAQAATRFDLLRRQLRFSGPVAASGVVFVLLLLFWPRKSYRLQYAAFLLLICCLGMVAGYGGSSSATPTSSSGTSAPNFAVVTLTATSAGGFSNSPTPVTHSVTLAVTLQ